MRKPVEVLRIYSKFLIFNRKAIQKVLPGRVPFHGEAASRIYEFRKSTAIFIYCRTETEMFAPLTFHRNALFNLKRSPFYQ